MITSFAILMLELLLFDREGGENPSEVMRDLWHSVCFILAAYVVVMGTYGTTYLPMPGVVLSLSMLSALFARSASGSGVARIFWESMLIGSIVISGVLAMGPHDGLRLVLILAAIWLPDRYFRYKDLDDLPSKHA
jgi:hypothetical protein